MTIIISKNGKSARRIETSAIEQEDYLQKYIYDNPSAIPLDNIKDEIRLLVLGREFMTSSGPIDALGIDKDGDIYIIETKLFKNPDKRLVVAQILDYGAALWSGYTHFDDFISAANEHLIKNSSKGFRDTLSEYFGLNESDVDELLKSAKNNLDQGRFQFVVLMNQCHDRLKDLLKFINHNSNFTIYGCELEFYKHDEYEIVIPTLYGSEIRKTVSSPTNRTTRKWDEETFLDALSKTESIDTTSVIKFYKFCKEYTSSDSWGKGSTGTFNPRFRYRGKVIKTVLSLTSNGNIWPYFSSANGPPLAESDRDDAFELKRKMGEILERLKIPIEKPDTIYAKDWVPKAEILIKEIRAVVDK